MESNNRRKPSQTDQPPTDGVGGDWRSQMHANSRQWIVNKIMDTFKCHLSSSHGHEGVQELRKIVMRYENKIYHAATSQPDYLRRISSKLHTTESKFNPPGPMTNAIPSNSAGMSRNSQDPGSPQINQHSSPEIDQQNLLPPFIEVGTPLQSANSYFAPSPMSGDTEKPESATSNAVNIIQQQTNIAPALVSSLAIATPGISASPLLGESLPPDGHDATLITPEKSGATYQPLERLLKVVKSMSSKALNASVDDIVSIVSMNDRIAGSPPGTGSRAAVGEDLVFMTKCHLQAGKFTQDGSSEMKRMRCYTAMPSNVASSVGSPNNSFMQSTELESTSTSSVKRRRIEVNPAILKEIREMNERLIDVVVDLSDEDVDPTLSADAAEGGEGTNVKCTFIAVSLSPNLKSQYCSAQMSPIQPLRLLVPTSYPNCSPILLDKFPVEVSKEYDDLSVKVKSRFSISLSALSKPMSLREIARTWNDCTRRVITEYAQQSGGGTFSSKYGSWENCLTAT